MNLINQTPYPALNFQGIDQLEQEFHVIVMRQTYTWNEQGLLIAADDQDAILTQDQLVDPKNLISGVIEESDLAHYKPKCDFIIKGHAYRPLKSRDKYKFTASITLKKPDSKIIKTADDIKYPFINRQDTHKNLQKNEQIAVKGRTLINKALTIHSPRQAIIDDNSILTSYQLSSTEFTDKHNQQTGTKADANKVSLNPHNSFGGYCYINTAEPKLEKFIKIGKEELIPEEDRNIYFNENHGTIIYMAEDNHNPAGSGYRSALYYQSIQPKTIRLPQIHKTDTTDKEVIRAIRKSTKEPLDSEQNRQLIAGFGVCSKSHPDRQRYVGIIDEEFISSDRLLPEGFDFAMWNCAYPDQQTDFLQGNEWLTLTNLCSSDTIGCRINKEGDNELSLYLPDTLAFVALTSKNQRLSDADLPMNLDTIIVSPDQQKVNLVWRAMIIGDYEPARATLMVIDKDEKEQLVEHNFACVAKNNFYDQ